MTAFTALGQNLLFSCFLCTSLYFFVQSLSNDRIFSLNLTFPDLSQYPDIFHILYKFLLNKSTDLSCISSLFMSTAIFTGSGCFQYILNVGTLLFLPDRPILYPGKCFLNSKQQWSKILDYGSIIGQKNG